MKASVVKHLESLFDIGTTAGIADGPLLERFTSRRDPAAFEAIVARHGPMVFNVCRRILPEPSDADDAFQATFLVLVRKAGTLRDQERLGPWLYGVAHRVATRARVQAQARQRRERGRKHPAAVEAAVETSSEIERRELLAVIDEEITRLPEKHRAVVVLCDLEGWTYEAAARHLDCPLGTLKSRLASGRQRLRCRLTRRGLAPAAATSATGVAAGSARAAAPAALAESTVKLATRSFANPAAAVAAGLCPASVLTLTQGVLMSMFVSRLKTIVAVILAITACAASLAAFAQPPRRDSREQPFDPNELRFRLQHQALNEMIKARERLDTVAQEVRDKTAEHLHQKLNAKIERDIVTVNLVATKVTDADLKALTVFENLQKLYLHHNAITDAGVANLKGLTSLRTLDLVDTRVTDAGLQHLAEWMPHLEWLELSDTKITDSSLRAIKGLKHLRRVYVHNTNVTDAGAEELRRAVPGVEIFR
jgi:RNA polymerase sigma factor (sigma-70 family)